MINNFSDIKVMYVESVNGINGASLAFDKLEAQLPTLKKRRFYGVVFGPLPNEKYWAAVEIIDDKEPSLYGFKTGVIPGGKYAQVKVKNSAKNLDLIGKTLNKLSREFLTDEFRPSVEFYRNMDEVLLRLPIK